MSPIEVAKQYLLNQDNHLTHMADGNFSVNVHDPTLDAHTVNFLPDADHTDLTREPYQVVTITKNIPTSCGFTIPKYVKLEISQDNVVQNVVESK